jgi:hypothetical protein
MWLNGWARWADFFSALPVFLFSAQIALVFHAERLWKEPGKAKKFSRGSRFGNEMAGGWGWRSRE